MKVEVMDLQGAALDWAVAKAQGYIDDHNGWMYHATLSDMEEGAYYPSRSWRFGGMIIEKEKIELYFVPALSMWSATYDGNVRYGVTALTAAMRAYVAGKFGDEIEIPEE